MSEIRYEGPYSVRETLVEAHRLAWRRIAEPGAWLEGERRVAVAAEARAAEDCALCRERKEALSPFAVEGEHAATDLLSAAEVELVHRLTTDPGRLTRAWAEGILADGVSEEAYIEIVSIVCIVTVIDTFRRSLDLPPFDLPAPLAGAPSGYRAPGAKRHDAWISLVQPEDVVASDGDLYRGAASPVVKAFSLVPQAKRDYWDLAEVHYLPGSEMTNFATGVRAIDRMQIELVAGRVSALHQCVY